MVTVVVNVPDHKTVTGGVVVVTEMPDILKNSLQR